MERAKARPLHMCACDDGPPNLLLLFDCLRLIHIISIFVLFSISSCGFLYPGLWCTWGWVRIR